MIRESNPVVKLSHFAESRKADAWSNSHLASSSYLAVVPPSIGMIVPVMKLPAGDASSSFP
jgi:hypothetical protein